MDVVLAWYNFPILVARLFSAGMKRAKKYVHLRAFHLRDFVVIGPVDVYD